ncbi:MAG: galactokinase family protein, partial [Traorella sp.]
MRYASLVINDLKSNLYLKTFKKIYLDETKVSQQKQRYLDAVYKFIELYGDQEIEIYSVPGRSEVCGNHTDHQHGEVVAAAINLDILAVVAKADRIKILSDDYDIQPIYLYDLEKKK